MKKLCCKNMEEAAYEYKAIYLEEQVRGYSISSVPSGVSLTLIFCPFCGVALGKRLHKEYYDVLEKEYGIDDPDIFNLSNVPEEFKSDEWWRKRGL